MRVTTRRSHVAVTLSLSLAACAGAADPPSLQGQWDATVVVNELEIPFLFEIADDGERVQGTFLNGPLRITSTDGRFENGTLALAFDQYASAIEATYVDGRLDGTVCARQARRLSLHRPAREHERAGGGRRALHRRGLDDSHREQQGRAGLAFHRQADRGRGLRSDPPGGWRHGKSHRRVS